MKSRKDKLMPPASIANDWAIMSFRELRKKYKVGGNVLYRWKKELNIPSRKFIPKPPMKRGVPNDFLDTAPNMGIQSLAMLYSAGTLTIRRWLRETKAARPSPLHAMRFSKARDTTSQSKVDLDHERAANYMRRHMAVSPCDENGTYKENGAFYRAGSRVVSQKEMIELAERYKNKSNSRHWNNARAA
jgi:hypothetical protein